MKATIYFAPTCGTARNALAILNDTSGVEVEVIEYLRTPPSRDALAALYARAGISARDGLRSSEPGAAPLKDAGNDEILDAMIANPRLIQRPLVATEKGVVLARLPERVLEIL